MIVLSQIFYMRVFLAFVSTNTQLRVNEQESLINQCLTAESQEKPNHNAKKPIQACHSESCRKSIQICRYIRYKQIHASTVKFIIEQNYSSP